MSVVKVGGSLFQWNGLPVALSRWLAIESARPIILIAGGGAFADLIRTADKRFHFGEERSHELCVQLLATTSKLLAAMLPGVSETHDWESLPDRALVDEPTIFTPVRFLQNIEPMLPDSLPRTWATTTDSIAARVAGLLGADELVLLKSAPPPTDDDFTQLAENGYVDGMFPTVAAALPSVRFVDLRNA